MKKKQNSITHPNDALEYRSLPYGGQQQQGAFRCLSAERTA